MLAMPARAPVEYLVIGHITKDVSPLGASLGGTVAYAGLTAHALGLRIGAVTSADAALDLGPLAALDLARQPSDRTTTFENHYTPGGREQTLRALASPLGASSVPQEWTAPRIAHLGPVAGEVDPSLAEMFPNSLVGLTPQGWMRAWDETGRVHPAPWTTAAPVLALADAVVVSLEDLGNDDGAAEAMARACRILAVTDGPRGARIFADGQARQLPAPPVEEVDPTGAGDVFAAAFFARLAQTGDPWEAGRAANFLAAASVTRRGIAGAPTPDEVSAALAPVAQ
jgi:hypothetical protein